MSDLLRLDVLSQRLAGRGAPLQAETALFVALSLLESLGSDVRVVTSAEVCIDPSGAVSVAPEAPTSDDELALYESLVAMLEEVLVPLPMNVIALAGRVRGGEITSRGAMTAELQSLLVPLNRGAAARQLGRLVREQQRAGARALDSAHGLDAAAADTLLDGTPLGALAGDDARAADTVLDAPLRGEWGDAPPPRQRPLWLSVAALFVSMALVGASAVFLWARLKGR